MRLCPESRVESEGDATALRDWAASAWDYLAMGDYPYPSSYIVNGAQPPLPAFPVRAACGHLVDAGLAGGDPGRLLSALASAVGGWLCRPAAWRRGHSGELRAEELAVAHS